MALYQAARGVNVNLGNGKGPIKPYAFYVPFKQPARYIITGVTKDSTGAALGACVVDLFDTATDTIRATTISDASGNYLVDGQIDNTYYLVAYKTGAPDVSGTTVNTLIAVPA